MSRECLSVVCTRVSNKGRACEVRQVLSPPASLAVVTPPGRPHLALFLLSGHWLRLRVTSFLTVPSSPSFAPTMEAYWDRGSILVFSIISSFLLIVSSVSLLPLPAWTATDVTIVLKCVLVCVNGKDVCWVPGRPQRFLWAECAFALRGSGACVLSAEFDPCTFLRNARHCLASPDGATLSLGAKRWFG